MSNKTQLQTNNTALDALITRVNAAKDTAASLPEAGGGSGGSVETCTVTIVTQGVGSSLFNTFYPVTFNSSNNEIECSSYSYGKNSSTPLGGIVKGSILVCTDVTNAVTISCSTGATKLFLKNNIAAFFISPDAPDSVTITLSNT